MAVAFSLNIKGIKEVKDALKKNEKAITDALDMEMTAYAVDIEALATRKVKKYFGASGLSGAFYLENKKLNKTVGNSKLYAPYVEFGTGATVDVPKGLEGYAMQFKGRGIRKVNLPARPFLFNSQRELFAGFIKRVKNLIK